MSPTRYASRYSSFVLAALSLAAMACGEHAPTAPNQSEFVAVERSTASLSAPSLWGATGPGAVSVVNNGSTSDPTMTYALTGTAVFSSQTWSFSTVAASSGAITETYDYSGFHAFFQVRLFLRPFVIQGAIKSYLPGAIFLGPVNCCSSPSAGFHLTGSTVFNVNAGDTYGYEFGGSNFDSDSRLLGTFRIVLPTPPADVTPPTIAPVVTGVLTSGGWYASDALVSWTVTDGESAISSSSGCSPTNVNYDTPGVTLTCTATSAGGTATASVTVKRDVSPPIVSWSGVAATYSVDQQVTATCSSSDPTSGILLTNCTPVNQPAYTFGLGTHQLFTSATNGAGIGGSAEAFFTVTVNSGSLCELVKRFVSQKGIANSMCQQLANGAHGAFRNHVEAQSGKSVTAANAAILRALSLSL